MAAKNEIGTEQFNIRISKELIGDMDLIARCLSINRNDWFKYKLAGMIRAEKDAVVEQLENNYVKGRVSDREFKSVIGYKPSDSLKQKRRAEKELTVLGREAAARYIRSMAKQAAKRK